MRGDRPTHTLRKTHPIVFTPHARGSTRTIKVNLDFKNVYPACAGIDLTSFFPFGGVSCLPRMRGDRPDLGFAFCHHLMFTPHARGST